MHVALVWQTETNAGLNSNLMTPDFPHNIRIKLDQLDFLCCVLMLLNWDSQQGNVRTRKLKFQLDQSYFYIMRKVWCHQIWIQSNLGFIVLILNCISTSCAFKRLPWSVRQLGKSSIFQLQSAWMCIAVLLRFGIKLQVQFSVFLM